MTKLNDQEFTNLVKKSKKKNLLKNIVTVLFILALVLGIIMFYFNFGPFKGEKVAGIPNNQIKILEEQGGLNSLIFDTYSSYGFNTKGKKMTVYLDYYKKDKRIKHESLVSIENEKVESINGHLYWAIDLKGKELMINLSDKGVFHQNNFDLSQLNVNPSKFASSSLDSFETGKIKKGYPYFLLIKTMSGTYPANPKDNFRKEFLVDSSDTLFLYFEIN